MQLRAYCDHGDCDCQGTWLILSGGIPIDERPQISRHDIPTLTYRCLYPPHCGHPVDERHPPEFLADEAALYIEEVEQQRGLAAASEVVR